jgi:hypothetical protein
MQSVAATYKGGITNDFYIVFASSFFFFGIMYFILRFIMSIGCQQIFKSFNSLSKENKRDYLSRVASTLHAILSCVASVISTVNLCE